jgi:hypothetical protein
MKIHYFSLLLFVVANISAEESFAPEAMSETRKHKAKHWRATTKNVGYPQNELPVPITPCQNRQLANFPPNTLIHHGSAAEPTLAVNPLDPDNIVALWQQDRINNSGALFTGIAYTYNGKKWHRMTVPAVQTLTQICTGGFTDRMSDVWADWSIDGETLFTNTLVFNITENLNTLDQQGVVTNVSLDGGKTWNGEQRLAATQDAFNKPGSTDLPFDDKNSITVDRNISNNAYATWERFRTVFSDFADTFFSRTTNQGLIWEDARIIYNPDLDTSTAPLQVLSTFNNIIVVLPNSILPCELKGNLLNFMTRTLSDPDTGDRYYDYAFIRSTDYGVTWDTEATVVLPAVKLEPNGNPLVFTGGYTYDGMGNITGGVGELMRTADSAVFDVEVDPTNGDIYLAFQSTRFRTDFLPQIGITISRDGGTTWTNPVRINRTPQLAPNPQAFTPAIAITEDGYLGLLYADFRKSNIALPNTQPTRTNAWFDIYKIVNPAVGNTGVGLDFDQELRLSEHSFIAQNGPTTTSGIMTFGDYMFVVAAHNRFYAAFTQSHNGPFTPETVLFTNPDGISLLLDDNFRQSPYVSIIKRKHHNNG